MWLELASLHVQGHCFGNLMECGRVCISQVFVMQANQNFLFYVHFAWIGRVCWG